jgi:TonB family protein
MAIMDMRLGVLLKPDGDGLAMWIEPGSQMGYESAGGAASLALRVEPSGTDLMLTWSKTSEAIANAAQGVLSITDGDRHEHYDMDANQLKTGSIVYSPVTGDVSFKLEVTGKNQTTTAESVHSLRTGPSTGAGHLSQEDLRAIAKDLYARTGGISLKGKVIKSIIVSGLSDQEQADLLSRLPVHVGDALTEDVLINVDLALGKYDRRLGVSVFPDKDAVVMQIAYQDSAEFGVPPNRRGSAAAPAATMDLETSTPVAKRIRVGGNVQAANLVSRVDPVYPPLAKQAQIQGTVSLSAVIGKDGHVQDIRVISGHPLLVQAALDAVKEWVYRTTSPNGEPVEVSTTIEINFALQ